MKKWISIITLCICSLAVCSCSEFKYGEEIEVYSSGTGSADELADREAFGVKNIFTNESKQLLINDELTLADILKKGTWNSEGTTDCLSNIEITINGKTYKYHSDCGTFNDKENRQYLSLDEDMKEIVNTLLAEYVSMISTEVSVD